VTAERLDVVVTPCESWREIRRNSVCLVEAEF
jgi:hypothetical protein